MRSIAADRDRRSLPLQLRDEVLELIVRQDLAPGDQLPSEAALAARFEVGRTTVREALKFLEQDGLIDVRHGRGRFLSEVARLERPITRLESVTEMMEGLGYEVTTRVLSVDTAQARPHERAALQLRPGQEVVRLERLRLQGSKILIYSVDVFARERLPDAIDGIGWSGSLFQLLEGTGSRIASATAQIQAAALPRGVARQLGTRGREPWLLLIQRAFLDSGQPIIASRDYHRGDLFTFHVLRRRSR